MEELDIKEINEMIKPNIEKTEAEISQEFLQEFDKLVRKYGRDFQIPPPQLVKVEFVKPKNDIQQTNV